LKPQLYERPSQIIFHQRLLHQSKDAFDEPEPRFVNLQWKLVLHFLFESVEKI
jgi:hypothetical protein